MTNSKTIPLYFLALSCGTPPAIADGTVTATPDTYVGANATHVCNAGFDMNTADPNTTCTPTGALTVDWLPTPPMCNSKSYYFNISLL